MTDQPAKRAPRKATPKATPKAPEAPAEAPAPPAVPVSVAWAAVMRDVEPIRKDQLNKTPGASFKYRGIDDVMNAVGPVLRRHGVVVVPHSVEILESERYDTKSGTAMHGIVTRHGWNVIGPAGDGFLMATLGQAADAGDKAASKASSVAYRIALLQALTIPTGDPDPDGESHERAVPDPRQEQWDRIAGLAKYAGMALEPIRKHFREKVGKEIDGAGTTVDDLTGYADRLEASFKEQAEKAAAQESQGGDKVGEPLPTDAQTAGYEGGRPAHDHDGDNAAPQPPMDPPPAETAPESVPAQPEPHRPTQGRDPRQGLWDDILASAKVGKMSADAVRAHFRDWSRTANNGESLEIDGAGATSDLLTRYCHVLRAHVADTQAGQP